MRRGMLVAALVAAAGIAAVVAGAVNFETRSMDGGGNNAANPTWGKAGTTGAPVNYLRVGPVNYANGVERVQPGPDFRFISNRILNDAAPAQGNGGQNVFSERNESQWGWTWGQFIDHDFGLRDETPGDGPALPFNANDPLEAFRNDFGAIDFSRTQPSPGSGYNGVPRAHINTITSYIDGSGIFGSAAGNGSRIEWLRDGAYDWNLANNQATLFLLHTTPGNRRGDYLPRRSSRGNTGQAPLMDLMGPLAGQPGNAAVAGDVRANENIALTATHTLFAREHNRIVAALPSSLSQEDRFQIARRVVGAEIQFVTYNEFLPSLGVTLPAYTGYKPNVNATLSEEFAVVGYRAHSMIHGEFEPTVPANKYSPAQLDAFRRFGIEIEDNGDGTITLVIPLSAAFGNPDMLQSVGEDQVLESLGVEPQYKNDEMFDNSLRSVLFQVPKPGVDPAECQTPVIDPDCFVGVADLGAIDVARQRDHGIAYYNDLRAAYGLARKSSFRAVTGESTDQLPAGMSINDPRILDFVSLKDAEGNELIGTDEAAEEAVSSVRRSTIAARLRAIYGDVNKVDAFVGMLSEPHAQGSEFGELQLAIWRKQFQALRDGDRFFYLNDQAVLNDIRARYGIDYRRTLAQVIRANTGAVVANDVFKATG